MVGFKGQDIVSIKGISAGYDGVQDVEEIPLVKPVSSTGNIEVRLHCASPPDIQLYTDYSVSYSASPPCIVTPIGAN